jgi:hypothetical protein
VTPGRTLVTDRVDLVYVIIWSIALANVFGALICVALARPIASLTAAPYALIAPFMITLIYFAAFQTSRNWGDLVFLSLLGLLGVFMKRFGWSRAALLIGFVLSPSLENSVSRTVQIYGIDIFLRPTALVILAVAAVSIWMIWRSRKSASMGEAETTEASLRNRRGQVAFALALLAFTVFAIADTAQLRFLAYVFPVSAAILTGLLILLALRRITVGAPADVYDSEAEYRAAGGEAVSLAYYFGWLLLLPGLALIFGFFLSAPLYVAIFLRRLAGRSWLTAGIGAGGIFATLHVLAQLLGLNYPSGVVTDYLATLTGLW